MICAICKEIITPARLTAQEQRGAEMGPKDQRDIAPLLKAAVMHHSRHHPPILMDVQQDATTIIAGHIPVVMREVSFLVPLLYMDGDVAITQAVNHCRDRIISLLSPPAGSPDIILSPK